MGDRIEAVSMPHIGVTSVGSSIDGLIHSRVEVCGLEMLGKEKRDTE